MKTLLDFYKSHTGKVSDKWALYLREYDRLFAPYREKAISMLEIGIQNGGSLEIWSQYFPNALKFVGCDINPDCAKLTYADPRISVIVGDATTLDTQARVFEQSASFDLIIEDGSHTSSDIIKAFVRYFPALKTGGLFVAEDLHCSYWQEYEGGIFHPYSSINFFKHLADVVNHEHWGIDKKRMDLISGFNRLLGIDFDESILAEISSIEFLNSICIVRKKTNNDNSLGMRIVAGDDAVVVPFIIEYKDTESTAIFQNSNEWSLLNNPPAEAYKDLCLELGRLKEIERYVNDQKIEINILQASLNEKDNKISDLEKSVLTLKADIIKIFSSRYWRLTYFFRALRRFFLTPFNFNKIIKYFYWRMIGFGWGLTNNFDSVFYLRKYPDVALANINPLIHYLRNGRHEGRLPNAPKIVFQGNIEIDLDPSLENVLIVSHEASRTGAPILSLNLVRILSERYNVIVLLMGGGALVSSFRDEGAVVIGPCDIRHNPLIADKMLDQLLAKCQLKFALVNSIESRVVLPILAKHFIPCLSLLHEFASYTRPRDAFRQALFWSGEAIFSSNLTLQSVLNEYPDLGKRFAYVIPQGRCLLPKEKIDDNLQLVERERIRKAMRPPVNGEQPFLVLGAGYVQIRKGVDLFIDCAARVIQSSRNRSIRFVWVGKGYDPENEVHYSVYLADQIERAGLTKHITFIDETSEMDDVYKAADLLLLTSRLDPLPNVAIDALSEGLPVMCFDKTTGIADILAEGGLREDCVAEYLDTQALAEKIVRLAEDNSYYQVVAVQCKQIAAKTFGMENYVRELENIAEIVAKQSEQEARDMVEVLESNSMDLKYFRTKNFNGQPLDEAVRGYVRSWAVGIGRRKPFPGFHPGIYLERHGVKNKGTEPLADYLRSGSPDGPWRQSVIRDTDLLELNSRNARVALHLHVFYPDLLPAMLERINQNVIRPDLFISVGTGLSAEDVAKQLINYTGKIVAIEVVPNRGRDIGPFLTTFGTRISADYDFVGHLHTKKSADVKDASMGADWYEFLLENLLGGTSGGMMDRILAFMINRPSIGMVFPDDPNVIGWSANKPFAETLAQRLGITELPEHFVFPVGTMFWARVDALSNFWGLDLHWDDYPEEPLPYDGSVLHALERLFPLGLAESANQCALTNVTGFSR